MKALLWPGALWWLLLGLALWLIVSLRKLDRAHPKPMQAKASHLDEIHHGYFGALIAAGILVSCTFPRWLVLVTFALALLMALDDAWQHYVQAYRDKKYKSPGWRFYRWLVEILK